MGLRPAEFWTLSPKQLDYYLREYDLQECDRAELLRKLIGRAATLITSPFSGGDPITLDEFFPPFASTEPTAAASQTAHADALEKVNEARFDVLWRVAEAQAKNGGK